MGCDVMVQRKGRAGIVRGAKRRSFVAAGLCLCLVRLLLLLRPSRVCDFDMESVDLRDFLAGNVLVGFALVPCFHPR